MCVYRSFCVGSFVWTRVCVCVCFDWTDRIPFLCVFHPKQNRSAVLVFSSHLVFSPNKKQLPQKQKQEKQQQQEYNFVQYFPTVTMTTDIDEVFHFKGL